MTVPAGQNDPKVVLQAHTLRVDACTRALLHGTSRPRTSRRLVGTLYGSMMLAILILIVVVVAGRIAKAL